MSSGGEPQPASTGARKKPPALLKPALAVAASVFCVLLLEGVASLVVAYRSSSAESRQSGRLEEEKHSRYDADLGWMHIPDLFVGNMYGEGVEFTTNGQSFRAKQEYSKTVPAGTYRTICLGDSFTMGYGVHDDATFPAQLQSQAEGLEVVNMGMGGFGVDQDYLWYMRDGVELETDLLLFAFIELDFGRMMFDRFLGYPKPLLKMEDGELLVTNVPVPEVFGLSRFRRFLQMSSLSRLVAGAASDPAPRSIGNSPDSLPFAPVAEHIFLELAKISRERNQDLVLVYLPRFHTLRREPVPTATWLEKFTRKEGIHLLNLTEDFRQIPRQQLAGHFRLPDDGHYSPRGNALVATALLKKLRTLLPDFPR